MIHDTETGESITTNGPDFLEAMVLHFAGRVARATPDATVEQAAAMGVRLGVSFLGSLMEAALNKQDSRLFVSLMENVLAQRDAWALDDMTHVQFVDMTPRPTDTMN